MTFNAFAGPSIPLSVATMTLRMECDVAKYLAEKLGGKAKWPFWREV